MLWWRVGEKTNKTWPLQEDFYSNIRHTYTADFDQFGVVEEGEVTSNYLNLKTPDTKPRQSEMLLNDARCPFL